jgi:hypothetical protein
MKEPIRLEYRQVYHDPRKSARRGEEPSLGCCWLSRFLGGWISVFSRLFSQPFLSLLHLVSAEIFAAGAWRRPIGAIPSPILQA